MYKYICMHISVRIRWLNKVKRVLRSDTRPVSRLYDFQA